MIPVPVPALPKSVLIQTYRLADPTEAETSREIDSRVLQLKPTVSHWDDFNKFYTVPDPQPHKNAWYLIKDTATGGLTMSEVFRDLPQDHLMHSRKYTSCVQIGSYLYDIGGCGSTNPTHYHYTHRIRRLDTTNPSAGWKTLKLPFSCKEVVAEACGNFIYLLPVLYPLISSEGGETWCACVYDTIEQKSYTLESPLGFEQYPWKRVCAPLDVKGLLVPLTDEDDSEIIYLHKPEENCWERLDHYSPIPRADAHHHAVSNGILYVCDRKAVLYAYDLNGGRLICRIDLPLFDGYDTEVDFPLFVVPVSDFELCFLWSIKQRDETAIFYVKVSLSLHPPEVEILNEASFSIPGVEVLNCMPLPF